jgi:hypothetical protein
MNLTKKNISINSLAFIIIFNMHCSKHNIKKNNSTMTRKIIISFLLGATAEIGTVFLTKNKKASLFAGSTISLASLTWQIFEQNERIKTKRKNHLNAYKKAKLEAKKARSKN